ncbi:hypothetical protein BDR06DRAFT_972873 [Suillus hirtellus]|nr:hypothetical protein BDR06DRAFT_972873 [Suillus hirtellus]
MFTEAQNSRLAGLVMATFENVQGGLRILEFWREHCSSWGVQESRGYWSFTKARQQISLDYATQVVRGSVHQAGHEPRSTTLRHIMQTLRGGLPIAETGGHTVDAVLEALVMQSSVRRAAQGGFREQSAHGNKHTRSSHWFSLRVQGEVCTPVPKPATTMSAGSI